MLRNLKVGTKLFVILLAPMIVIVALVAVGVRDRRASSVRRRPGRGAELVRPRRRRPDQPAPGRAAPLGRLQRQPRRRPVGTSSTTSAPAPTPPSPATRPPSPSSTPAPSRFAGGQHRPGQEPPQQHPGRPGRRRQQPQPALHRHRALRRRDRLVRGRELVAHRRGERPGLLRGLDAMSRVDQLREAQNQQATLLVAAAQAGGFTDRSGALCPTSTATASPTSGRSRPPSATPVRPRT